MPERKYARVEDVKTIQDAIRTLNREMGEVQGELRWIRWLLMGVLSVLIGQWVIALV